MSLTSYQTAPPRVGDRARNGTATGRPGSGGKRFARSKSGSRGVSVSSGGPPLGLHGEWVGFSPFARGSGACGRALRPRCPTAAHCSPGVLRSRRLAAAFCGSGAPGRLAPRARPPVFARPGSDLLSHALRRSTIGAEGLHGRVRNGIGCFPLAITTRPCKHRPRTCKGPGKCRTVRIARTALYAYASDGRCGAKAGRNVAHRRCRTGF